ncbi:HAD hydrolase-like protein [Thermosynechococcaceae cyanobacterium BACA0444]|uniref:HAD hydrolase-like protein n=1 Tax=Pseudocalidococcus azoricus BACA0444 TaxID=2918990 RepID=A0AAE4FQ44_9CYAN|nr:HAD family hydrolase [Pseudocalidococcus azoricus]MDS3859247.1 HAD hydrolase-like protein [Pseudocalidococcus azoricus BACA0444]
MFDLGRYKTFIFDCDGVILNSNKLKTEGFYYAALPYGEEAAQALRAYHINHGGISRYSKFNYFFQSILEIPIDHEQMRLLLESYASYVREGLYSCEMAPGLSALRKAASNTKWLVVSGGDQAELREVFNRRGIHSFFDGGIFGSPDDKKAIFERELKAEKNLFPSIFFGDSKYDYEVTANTEIDFIFLSEWSELQDWKSFVDFHKIQSTKSISSLLSLL